MNAASSNGTFAALRRTVAKLIEADDDYLAGERRKVLTHRSEVAAATGLVVVPFTILSYLILFHPEKFLHGVVIVTVDDLGFVAVLIATRLRAFHRHYHLPMFLVLAVIANFAQTMTLQLLGGGAISEFFFPYYLIFFTMVVMFPARIGWVAATSASLVAAYVGSELVMGRDITERVAMSNLIHLIDASMITCTGSLVVADLFLRERRGRHDLEKANDQLRELDRAKSNFFANVSHELRTPLTLILAPLDTLLEGTGEHNAPHRLLVETIRRNASRLLSLINDPLLLARGETGIVRAVRDPVDLVAVARGVVESARPLAEELELILELRAPDECPTWSGDPGHLERILLNLVSNACKFSSAGGHVEVSVELDEGNFYIGVRDEGVGIAPQHLGRIFDRFVQAESQASRRFEGTGIGLAIVKELVDSHGGNVEVQSMIGKGSMFRVRLPRIADETQACVVAHGRNRPTANVPGIDATAMMRVTRRAEGTLEVPAVDLDPGRARLLLVEDNGELIDYLARELRAFFRVTATTSSAEGLRLALDHPPDVIVSDVMMPGMDGIELCERLRADERTHDVPIILLSARGEVAAKVEGFNKGADDYVQKPFRLPELLARIHLQLRLHRQSADLRRRNDELTSLSEELGATLDQLRETEVRMVQQEKMATLGTVVAGVAHEINNPLHFVKGNLALLLRRVAQSLPPEKAASTHSLFEDMRLSLERIANITRELSLFGRSDTAITDVNLPEMCALVVKMLGEQLGAAIQVRCVFEGGEVVHANSQALFQVLVNLVQNAIHAVGDSGNIEIATRLDASGSSELSVRDDGCGIPPEIVGRIFDPFFTTKPAGKGTGLGLAIVERLVTSSGGTIAVTSRPLHGTTFTLRLPSAASARPPAMLAATGTER